MKKFLLLIKYNLLIKHTFTKYNLLTKHIHHRVGADLVPAYLFIILLLIPILLLTACTNSPTTSSTANTPIHTPSTTHQPSGTTLYTSAIGKFSEFSLPQARSGIMRPAIDHKGRLWFGEMGKNALASFDPLTQTFQQMNPPGGASGIMGIAVATDDSIWFAEQYANYIGHYTPNTQQYQIYNLPSLTTQDPSNKNNTLTLPSAPNDLALDALGNVWFTEMNADTIGKLDIQTGQIKHYPLSPRRTVQTLTPYGITVNAQGIIWFTEASTNNLGRLDPLTGIIRLFTPQKTQKPLMEVICDPQGTIWATTFNDAILLNFHPDKESFTEYLAPDNGSGAGGLYGLTSNPRGEIWVTITAANQIARLDIATKRFITYQIPTPGSLPLGIVTSGDQMLWFTEAGSNKIGMLKP